MKAALLTIGDELLIGQVLNSNVQWMSEKLTDLGIVVTQQLTVGDTLPAIHQALQNLLTEADVLVIGGGLGPTHDDLTLEALSQYFKIPLEYDADWISKVEAFFKSRNRIMSENNKKQGFLIKNATRIDNDCGTAAGQYLQHQQKHIFVVPGVPHEMKSMMNRFILPTLTQLNSHLGEKILKKTLLTTGMGESALAQKCDPFVKKIKSMPHVSLAFLPNAAQVRLRLQMNAKNAADEIHFEQLVNELELSCGSDFYGYDPLTFEQFIVGELKRMKKTVATAESCTGGLIAHLLTQVPGVSEVFCGSIIAYQPAIKICELNLTPSFLQEHGEVSEASAIAMAEGVLQKWNTDYAISTTGYLGPSGGDAHAPVGTVWIAIARKSQTTITRKFVFESHRERAKERAAQSALDLLRRHF